MKLPIVFALFMMLEAAEVPSVRAELQAINRRRPAPAFALQDGAGKTVKLKQYRGKVVVLDFWATWCHGCKQEIPFFSDLENKYRKKGLAVVGVSLDGEGWKVLRPFLAAAPVPYRMLLGNDQTAKQYGIEGMPDTFLIDKSGRIAAAYRAGLVDEKDVEANVQALLSR